jgi:cytochrome c-type biogenesis protein CcmE
MRSSNKKKRIIFISGIFFICLISVIFVVTNFKNNIVFYYSPSELQNPQIASKATKIAIRVGGLVKKHSFKTISNIELEFVVTDLSKDLTINYHGLLPNLFKEGQGVVAKGKLDQMSHKFIASELLVKHDEKYMPPEVAKSLKKTKIDRL